MCICSARYCINCYNIVPLLEIFCIIIFPLIKTDLFYQTACGEVLNLAVTKHPAAKCMELF